MATRGRPRRAESDAEIVTAAAELLRTQRYGTITLDEIARRAGVAKTTIYRRWPSKAALAADVLRSADDLMSAEHRRTLASLIGEAQENDDTRAIVRELLAARPVDRDALLRLLIE